MNATSRFEAARADYVEYLVYVSRVFLRIASEDYELDAGTCAFDDALYARGLWMDAYADTVEECGPLWCAENERAYARACREWQTVETWKQCTIAGLDEVA